MAMEQKDIVVGNTLTYQRVGYRITYVASSEVYCNLKTLSGPKAGDIRSIQMYYLRAEATLGYSQPKDQGKSMANGEKKWNFKINAEYRIDFHKIAKDLSHSNPIAYVIVKDSPAPVVVLVKKTFSNKMNYCEGGDEMDEHLSFISEIIHESDSYIICSLSDVSNISEFVKIFKNLHEAKILPEYRKDTTVYVTLPEI